MFLKMPENHPEISGYWLTEIFTSNRDSSKNHKKNLTENFCPNSYVKTFDFQLFGTFSKNAKSNLTGDIFSPFFEICQGQALSVEKLTWSPSLATRPLQS